jgi:hypothetical protein
MYFGELWVLLKGCSQLGLSLVSDSLLSGLELSLINQVVVLLGLKILIEFKNERAGRRDVVSNDLLVGHASEMLNDSTEGVSVGDDDDALTSEDLGADRVVPVGQHAVDRRLQGLRLGQHVVGETLVAAVKPGVTLIIERELGRGDVEASAPLSDLLFTVLGGSLGLVESLKVAVVTLVESPGALGGQPQGVHLSGDVVPGLDGAGQHWGVGDIEFEALLLKETTSLFSFLLTLGGKVDIVPASEPVFKVPGGLTVTDEHDFVESWSTFH